MSDGRRCDIHKNALKVATFRMSGCTKRSVLTAPSSI